MTRLRPVSSTVTWRPHPVGASLAPTAPTAPRDRAENAIAIVAKLAAARLSHPRTRTRAQARRAGARA